MDVESLYQPSPWQALFHSLDVDEALGAGAAGPGKTLCLLMDPMQQAAVEDARWRDKRHQHRIGKGESRGWALHLRRATTMLTQTIAESHRIFPKLDPAARFWESENTWVFASGFRLQFGHCKDLNSWEAYLTNAYTHIAFDELIQFDEEQYRQIKARCRSKDPVLRNMIKIRSMSNPLMRRDEMASSQVRNPHWVRDYFVKPYLDRKYVAADGSHKVIAQILPSPDGVKRVWRRIYLPAKLDDNPDKEFVEGYKRNLLTLPAHVRRAYLDGDWWVTAGSFFASAWDARVHVCRPFNIPPDWKRFRSMDWGFKNPGCIHWWAMDSEENLYCTDELYFQGVLAHEVAAQIEILETRMGLWKKGRSLITGVADTQIWEERGQNAETIAAVMERRGVSWIGADKKSRAGNAQRIMARLSDQRGGQASLVFFANCTHAIEVVPSIGTDSKFIECPQDGGDDHPYDSVAYGVAFASRGLSFIPGHQKDEIELDDDFKPRRARGRLGYGSTV